MTKSMYVAFTYTIWWHLDVTIHATYYEFPMLPITVINIFALSGSFDVCSNCRFNVRLCITRRVFGDGIHFFVALQTVLRIWDCLFYEGSKILFRVALTLIHHNQDQIQEAQSLPDVCQNFKQITHGPFVEECHTFMQVKRKWVSHHC